MTKLQPFPDFTLKQATTFSYSNVKTNPIYLIGIVVSWTANVFIHRSIRYHVAGYSILPLQWLIKVTNHLKRDWLLNFHGDIDHLLSASYYTISYVIM